MNYTQLEAAEAIDNVLGEVDWVVAGMARGFLRSKNSDKEPSEIARHMYETSKLQLGHSKEHVQHFDDHDEFESLLEARERTGSAENPVTKLIPATITEEYFIDKCSSLTDQGHNIMIKDERQGEHKYYDFILSNKNCSIPVNVKTASTKFRNAEDLVGLDPDNCVPIPAYKAYGALEHNENLLYTFLIDFDLLENLNASLNAILTKEENITWKFISKFTGAGVRNAEDKFIFTVVRRHKSKLIKLLNQEDFELISARKAVKILKEEPQRTPGIGMRAWGTQASSEINVHVNVDEEMTSWSDFEHQVHAQGLISIESDINRKVQKWIYDPKI